MSDRTVVMDPSQARRDVGPSVDAPLYRLRLRGAVAALAAAAVCYSLMAAGVLSGAWSLALAGTLLLMVPSSTRYPLRIALNGSFVLGWGPFLWWVRWPVPVDHGAVIVSLGLGVVVYTVLASATPRARLRSLPPRPRAVDVLPALAALASVVAVRSWAFPTGGRDALVVLLPGVDNVAHFQIFTTMRAYGAILTQLPPAPGGGSWGFTGYPAGFHSAVASAADLLDPGTGVGSDALALYTRSVAVVIVLGATVLAAAIASLPTLEDRPWVCASVVTLPMMAFLWSPGQNVFFDGFATFWLGALAGGVALILSMDPRRSGWSLRTVAVVGLLLALSQIWAPLLLVSAPALLPFVTGRGGIRFLRGNRMMWAAVAVFAILVILALWRVFIALMHMASLRFLITATGGITGTPPIPTFALLILGLYLTVSFKTMYVRPAAVSADPGSMPRVRVLVVVPLMAVATAGTFLAAQIVIVGTTSYFFLKYFMGIELILAAWVPAILGLILAARLPRRSGPAGVVAGVAGVLVASQSFGLFPGQDVGWQAHPGGTANVGSRRELTAAADGLFRAIDASTQRTAFDRDYVALGDQRGAKAYYPDAWFHAAWATSNNHAGTRYDILRVRLDGAVGAAPTVRKVLESDPRLDVLVAPDQVAELRAGLGDGPLADRVITWPVAPAAP